MPEYVAWLRDVQRRNPTMTWQQIITKLHRDHQGGDENLWVPGFGITFPKGPENAGSHKVDVGCHAKEPIKGKLWPNTPKYVVDENGRRIDVSHIYAGLRSDINREKVPKWGILGGPDVLVDPANAEALARMNTHAGDWAQHVLMPGMYDLIDVWYPSPYTGGFAKTSWRFPTWWNIYDKWGDYAPPDQLRGNTIGLLARDIFAKQGYKPADWVDSLLQAIRNEGFIDRALPSFEKVAADKEAARKEAEKKEKEKKPQKPVSKVAKNKPNCKPGPASRRTALDPGFIAQKTAVEGPNYDQSGDCQPFGPVKKTYDVANLKPQIARDESRCVALAERINTAGSQYSDGLIRAAGVTLNAVLETLGKISDLSSCPDIRTRTATNIEKINRITEVIEMIEEGFTSCNPSTLSNQENLLKKSKNKKLVVLFNRIVRSKPVAVKYTQAKDAYHSGDIKKSKSLFRQALSHARKIAKPTCENIDARIGNNLDRIDTLDDLSQAANTALSGCDMERIETLKGQLDGKTNKFLIKIIRRLEIIPNKCKRELGNAACKSDFGVRARVDLAGSTGDEYSCVCQSGYSWKPNATGSARECIPAAEANRASQAENNAWCRKNQGAGYYAGPINKKGVYRCLPTRKTANRWCNTHNKGSGHYAGKIKSDGSFGCYRKNTPVARRQTPSRRQTQQPGFDPAAAAAITGLIFQGIDAYQRSKSPRRGGGSRRGRPLE